MIPATAASTSAAVSRLASSSLVKAASKPASRVASLIGIWPPIARPDGLAEAVNPAADFLRAGLQRGAIDDQPRAHLGDALALGQAVCLQCGAGLNQIDDMTAQAEMWSKLDRSVQLDAFRLHAACSEMTSGDFGVFGRHANVARPPANLACGTVRSRRDRKMAMPDIEVERCVNL